MNKQRGFTILEILAVLAVTGVLTTIGVPSMSQMLAKHRVESAATALQTHLRQVRSQAIKADSRVYLSFAVNGSSWRYGESENGTCDPNTVGSCKVNGIEQVFTGDAWRGVSVKLSQNLSDNSVGFEPRRGMVITPEGAIDSGTITVQSSAGTLLVNVSPIGRINICSPAGSGITRYNTCAS